MNSLRLNVFFKGVMDESFQNGDTSPLLTIVSDLGPRANSPG
jgi:hypothetical protein